jgi:AcrR family transcriptional regulator
MAGRPRSFDRDTALAAAVEQFWRTGYDDTTIATLTRAMGVTPPSLYAAFGDKETLFEEASTFYFHRTCEAVDRAAQLPTAAEAIAQMLLDTARAHTATGTPPGCLMLGEPRLADQREALRERIRSRLERGIADGDIAEDTQPDHVAAFVVVVMQGMSARAKEGGTAEELLAIAATAVTAIERLDTVTRSAS